MDKWKMAKAFCEGFLSVCAAPTVIAAGVWAVAAYKIKNG